MEWKYSQWTVCEKNEDGVERYYPDAAHAALSWFFEWNAVGESTVRAYGFLKRFLISADLNDAYGRLFFVTAGDGVELQKYTGHPGFHDDHTSVTSVYLVKATENGLPERDHPIKVDPKVAWMPLEDHSPLYRKEWFADCTDAKVFIEEKFVTGAYYGKVTSPVFLITDIPGATGCYLLKVSSHSN